MFTYLSQYMIWEKFCGDVNINVSQGRIVVQNTNHFVFSSVSTIVKNIYIN